jgi:hypothetical protein
MAVARDAKGELRRLVLARTDIESADALVMVLIARPSLPPQIDRQAARLGLWTGALVSYARPFKRGGVSVGNEWQHFPDNRLDASHANFLKLRDKLFAHNDAMPQRDIRLVPPSGADERPMKFKIVTVHSLKRLCMAQLERMNERIEKLATELAQGQRFVEGEAISLSSIPDTLELVPTRSPFRAPTGPGGHRWEEAERPA